MLRGARDVDDAGLPVGIGDVVHVLQVGELSNLAKRKVTFLGGQERDEGSGDNEKRQERRHGPPGTSRQVALNQRRDHEEHEAEGEHDGLGQVAEAQGDAEQDERAPSGSAARDAQDKAARRVDGRRHQHVGGDREKLSQADRRPDEQTITDAMPGPGGQAGGQLAVVSRVSRVIERRRLPPEELVANQGEQEHYEVDKVYRWELPSDRWLEDL